MRAGCRFLTPIATAWVSAALVAAICGPLHAQRSPVINFQTADVEMNAAIEKARGSLDVYWRHFDKPSPGEDGFALKVAIPIAKPNSNEHIWMGAIERRPGGRLAGSLNNQPSDIPGKLGNRFEFAPEQISDWLFMRNGKMVGAETLRPMMKHMPKAEADRLRAMLENP